MKGTPIAVFAVICATVALTLNTTNIAQAQSTVPVTVVQLRQG
jgi:hypothetical protein